MRKMNKKGFTLIELLAVIVILGVVMAIAIPSMNTIIDNSKKDTLVSTAQEFINGAKTMLVSENSLPDYGKALVVPISEISLDRGGKSPFTSTDFEDSQSYVVVVNEADVNNAGATSSYTYYIALMDSSKNCLLPTSEAALNNKAKVTRGYVKSGSTCNNTTISVTEGSTMPTSFNGVTSPSTGVTFELYK